MSADKAARLAAIREANARKAAAHTQTEPAPAPEAVAVALPMPNPGMALAGANGNASPWRIPYALHIIGALLLAAVIGLLISAVLHIWQPILAYTFTSAAPSVAALWQWLAALPLVANPPSFLTISRATALVCYLALWLSMMFGLAISSKATRLWPGGPAMLELHQQFSLLGLLFALAHVFSLLGESRLGYGLAQALLPWVGGSYRPFWVGLVGKMSLYLMLVVWLSFYVRKWVGGRWWRRIHYLSFAVFLLGLIHGIFAGSDTSAWWGQALYILSGVALLALLAYRVVRSRRVQSSEVATLQHGTLSLDPIARVVKLGARRTTLRATEARLLYFLMQNAGRVLSAEQIIENVWGRHYRGQKRLVVRAMQRLRAKIEPATAPGYIQEVQGQGYRFGTPPLIVP